jgi:hypothetical protein
MGTGKERHGGGGSNGYEGGGCSDSGSDGAPGTREAAIAVAMGTSSAASMRKEATERRQGSGSGRRPCRLMRRELGLAGAHRLALPFTWTPASLPRSPRSGPARTSCNSRTCCRWYAGLTRVSRRPGHPRQAEEAHDDRHQRAISVTRNLVKGCAGGGPARRPGEGRSSATPGKRAQVVTGLVAA